MKTLHENPENRLPKHTGTIRLYLIGAAAVLVSSGVLAGILTDRIGDSHIRIGIDLVSKPSETPVILFGNDTISQKEMERIPEEFSTSHTLLEFEIIATGQKNAASRGTEVIADGLTQSWRITKVEQLESWEDFTKAERTKKTVTFEGSASPDGIWDTSSDGNTLTSNHLSTLESVFHVKKYLPVHVPPYPKTTYEPDKENNFTFYLSHSPRGGIAIVRTPTGEKTLDLHGQTGGKSSVDVGAKVTKNLRYYVSIPRRNFTHAKVFFGTDNPPEIYRLYIASLIPKSFFRTERQPAHEMGLITENWQPLLEDGYLVLPPLPVWERGGGWTFLAVLLLSSVAVVLAGTILRLMVCTIRRLLTDPARPYAIRPFSWKTFFHFYWPILLVLLIWWICFYPGLMSPDSVSQWKQAHGDQDLYDATPVFHTLIWRGLFAIWDCPAIIITVHVLVMSGLLAYAFNLLRRLGIPNIVVIIAYAASVLSIRNGFMAVLLWKGTLHGAVILGMTILLVHLVANKGHTFILWWIVLGLVLALSPLLRHNGLSVFAGMLVLLPLFFWPVRQKAIVAVLATLLSYGAVLFVLYPALGVEKYTQTHMPANRIARYLTQDIPLREREYRLIDEYTPLFKERWVYNNNTASGAMYRWLSWPMAHDQVKYREVMRIFEPVPFAGIRMISYFHRHKYILWPPFSKYDGNIETVLYSHYLTLQMAKQYGFQCPCGFWDAGQDHIIQLSRQTLEPGFVWLFWRGGDHFWLILISLGICLRRHGDIRLTVVYLPVLLHTAGLLAVDSSQCARLLFPMTFATGFLVCFTFLPHPRQPDKTVGIPVVQDEKPA